MAQIVQSEEKDTVEKGVVASCPCLVSDSSSVVAERAPEQRRAALQSLDNPEISATDRSVAVLSFYERPAATAEDQRERPCAPWSAHAAEDISSASLGDRGPKRYENSDSKCGTSPGYWRLSASDSFPNAKFTLGGPRTSRRVGKTVGGTTKSGPRAPQWATGGTTQNHRGIPDRIRITGLLRLLFRLENGMSPNLPAFRVHRELLDVEKGCSEMEDDHRPSRREAGYQDHELSGLDGAGIRGWENLHGSPSAARRCGVNFEGLGCQGRLDPRKRVQTPSAKGTLQRGKRQGRVSATVHGKKVSADRSGLSGHHADDHRGTVLKEGARLSKQSEQNLNTLLNGSTELDDVAKALNLLDVERQEGLIKAAVKPVVRFFMEAGRFSGDRQCEEEKEEIDEQSGEEEHCPPLEETMAASWIPSLSK